MSRVTLCWFEPSLMWRATGDTQLTMLVVGTWADENQGLVRRIVTEGHDLGNHTWSHPALDRLGAAAVRVEVERCRDLLRTVVGTDGSWFRPSGTPHADTVVLAAAGAAGYPTCLGYDVDPLDYTDPGAQAVERRVLASARGGSIVSLHTLHAGTARLCLPSSTA